MLLNNLFYHVINDSDFFRVVYPHLNEEYFNKYNWSTNIPTSLEEFESQVVAADQMTDWIMGDFLILENENTPENKSMSMGYHTDRKVHPYNPNVVFNFNIYLAYVYNIFCFLVNFVSTR